MLGGLLQDLRRRLSWVRFTRVAAELSSFHRIQGSKEIVDAARYLRDIALNAGADVELIKFSYNDPPNWFEPLTGWWIRSSELAIVEPVSYMISSFNAVPTSVVAHSPGGEFEGELIVVRGNDLPDVLDGVVLTKWGGLEKYLEMCRRGAQAILFYRDNAPRNAVPYFSLFPTPDDVEFMNAPAFSVSLRDVEELERLVKRYGRVIVKGFIKAGYTDQAEGMIVSASFGSGNTEVHLVAHYCHPAGMINDNISGAAALAELALTLGSIPDVNQVLKAGRVRLVWVPEYIGSLHLLSRLTSEEGISRVAHAINLDMVGERQSVTGSTLLFVRPPIHMLSPQEAIAYKVFREVFASTRGFLPHKRLERIRSKVINFEPGSDHESYIAYGIPATALISWPDKYYHTSLDTFDKLDYDLALRASYFSFAAALNILSSSNTEKVFSAYRNLVAGMDILNVIDDDLLSELRTSLYREGLHYFRSDGPSLKATEYGVPNLRLVKRSLPPEEATMLRNNYALMPWFRTALTLTVMLVRKGLTGEGLRNALQAELGVRVSVSAINLIITGLLSINALSIGD